VCIEECEFECECARACACEREREHECAFCVWRRYYHVFKHLTYVRHVYVYKCIFTQTQMYIFTNTQTQTQTQTHVHIQKSVDLYICINI